MQVLVFFFLFLGFGSSYSVVVFMVESVKKLLLGFVVLLQALITVNISNEPLCHMQTILSGCMNFIKVDLASFFFSPLLATTFLLCHLSILLAVQVAIGNFLGNKIYQAQNWLNFKFSMFWVCVIPFEI